MMKDMLTPAGTDDVRATIKHCLEESALLNYNNIVHAACALLRLSSPPLRLIAHTRLAPRVSSSVRLPSLASPLPFRSSPVLFSSPLCFALL